jgi:hypothetical protein
MKNWIATLLSSDEAKEMQREYKLLLSVGLSELEAEAEIISFFISNATVSEQGILWILFALIQWNMGRMSQQIYRAAKQWINSPTLGIPGEALRAVANVLDCPMPGRKKLVKPRTIKCPWRKGTLLAYKISTCLQKRTSRFWNKYVLLRVVDIKEWPVSAIKPDLLFDESMYIAMYNWVGDSVPPASILENLEYTPISVSKPMLSQLLGSKHLDCLKSIVGSTLQDTELDVEYSHYVYALDWGNRKTASAVFTEIHDDSKGGTIFDIGSQTVRIPPLTGIPGFDITVIKRLGQLFPEDSEETHMR